MEIVGGTFIHSPKKLKPIHQLLQAKGFQDTRQYSTRPGSDFFILGSKEERDEKSLSLVIVP